MRTAKVESFKGTVAELAGKIAGPSGEPLNVQDVQFLTRIGNGSFAKKIGTAPSTGSRGGKRAIIWEISPTARLTLGKAENEPQASEASDASEQKPAAKTVEALVAEALAKHGITPAADTTPVEQPVKRGRNPKDK